MSTNPHEEVDLTSWRAGSLGQKYITHFHLIDFGKSDLSQIEILANELSRRPTEELLQVYEHIQYQIEYSIKLGDKKRAELFTRMKNHFYTNILGPQ